MKQLAGCSSVYILAWIKVCRDVLAIGEIWIQEMKQDGIISADNNLIVFVFKSAFEDATRPLTRD